MSAPNYTKTKIACYLGFITQAIAANFAPLLFLKFHYDYQISIGNIAWISTCFFFTQLLVDLFCTKFVDRIGYRVCIVASEVCAAGGLIGLAFLPEILPDPFVGILCSVILYAVGSGLIEVLCSPIIEACPFENKEAAMSLLHSFYCWGHVAVVLLSTIFFRIFGIENWKIMALIWAIVPIVNGITFTKVPIATLIEEGETGMTIRELCRNKTFWILMLMMLCAGASEQGVSQWASTFAEQGLGVTKTIGDLAGPMAFAILMGSSRAFYGKFGDRMDLDKFMIGSSILCIISYLCISLAPSAFVSLIGCSICGFSVGIMWPGSFSKASMALRRGGTSLFALLALAGDVGCSGGPTLVGFVSGILSDNLKKGILAGVIFPVFLLVGILLLGKSRSAE